MNPIFISRRCINCQELLIFIHKNTELRNKFKIIDIDTNPYPDFLKVVPTMIIDESLLFGDELFKYLNILLDKLTGRVTPPLENSSKPTPSELDTTKTEDDVKELDGYCIDGDCQLPFSSLEDDEFIDQKTFYEELEPIEKISDETLLSDTSEKHVQVSNDYEKMMKSRNELNT